MKFVITVALVALALAGCGSGRNVTSSTAGGPQTQTAATVTRTASGSSPSSTVQAPPAAYYEWPPAVRKVFVNTCTATSGGQASYCACAADFLARVVPADRVAFLSTDDPRMRAADVACSRGFSRVGHWPAAIRTTFVNACASSAGGRVSYCACLADHLARVIAADHLRGLTAADPRMRSAARACARR